MNILPELNLASYKDSTSHSVKKEYPIRVLQVGDGNFIRGFVDWMIYELNRKTDFEGSIVSMQATPRGKTVPKLQNQDGLFTLLLRGIQDGEEVNERHVVDSITQAINPYEEWSEALKVAELDEVEFLFSNTTEAGIQYEKETFSKEGCPIPFPAKVVSLLYHRYNHFQGAANKGWIIIPCELIENNGDQLKRICLKIADDWELPADFTNWMKVACTFCNTLVDRIVPGYPKQEDTFLFEQFGYKDVLLTVGEPYHLFVIDGPDFVQQKLPFKEAGLNVQFDKIELYRELKVKLLNAPHTMLAAIGLLLEIESVKEAMENPLMSSFIQRTLTEEIRETLPPMGKEKAISYMEQVFDRFANPTIHHRLADISLNSYAKFKARIWPSLYTYYSDFGYPPQRLVFAFAALLQFFTGVKMTSKYEVKDDQQVIQKFQAFYSIQTPSLEEMEKFIESIIKEDFLQTNEEVQSISIAVAKEWKIIREVGMKVALEKIEDGV
ncbi:tagaturonate reductase [Psychrobacillus sp. NPDC093180]|uniref:tagaturonate reductase n=1 Tax=Psychrobacillus sp. NPDC093180 TaxID=3364489 RepID=UPI0038300E0F